jgi:DNA-binding beta-propeller fold protein YncE
MKLVAVAVLFACLSPLSAALKSGPALPHHLVANWAKLPKGWNLGETSGVAVDQKDNVWVFNRGAHPVIEFDRDGNFIQSWGDNSIIKSSHGIRVDPEGNVWCVDVANHLVLKFSPEGRVLMVIGRGPGNNETKDAFNQPTGIIFTPSLDFFYVSDGYVNSRVVKFNRDGEYVSQWGHKGTGDGEFNLVHDVALDARGHVYVADRSNSRVQIFDADGKYLGKWTDAGQPWGLAYSAAENAIYMCDGLNNRIVKLNLDGEIQGVLSSYGRTPGKLDFAHNIAVDSTGAIYVSEIKNWRVQKWAK